MEISTRRKHYDLELTDHGLASLKDQKGTDLKKKYNKYLLKPYIVSDTDHDDISSITEDEKDPRENMNLLKPMEFNSHALQIANQTNQSIYGISYQMK